MPKQYISLLIGMIFTSLQVALAQTWPDAQIGQVQEMPAQIVNTFDHCQAGPASSENLPTWGEVVTNNRAFYLPMGSSGPSTSYSGQIPGATGGVPDLDNPMDNFTLDESLLNLISLLTNVTDLFENPGQLTSSAQSGQQGTAICRNGSDAILLTEVTYCEYVNQCGNGSGPINGTTYNKFLWVPDNIEFLHNLDGLTGQNTVAMVNEQAFTLPAGVTSAADGEKWSLKLLKIFDEWSNLSSDSNNAVGSAISALNVIKAKTEKFRTWWNNFTGNINRFTEGYHLGAFDEMRPDLHMCVGYYGHKTDVSFANLLGGEIDLGSAYNSFNVSREARSQVRTGGMELELFGKELQLLPTPEINIQYDGLRSWNCDAPFGIDMGITLCPTNPLQLPGAIANSCAGANYLSMDNLEPSGTQDFIQFGLMKDYYPIRFDGTGVIWPRRNPMNIMMSTPGSPIWSEDGLMQDELPSSAVMSAGLNLGYDFGLKEPAPRVLETVWVGPVQAVLKWDVDYGLRWVHDSNLLMEDLREALTQGGSTIDISTIWTRPMHALQADDLTADNGQELYVEPSLLLGVGYAIQKKKFGLNLTLDLGVHVDVEPSFYAGLADMNVALKDVMQSINGDDSLACTPVYAEEMVTVSTRCSADNFMHENPPLQSTWGKLDAGQDLSPRDVYYYCGKKPSDELKKALGKANLLSCESRGFCTLPDGTRIHNATAADCERARGRLELYSCQTVQKTEIVGWEGPGCSPMMDGTGFPSAPGGMCKPGLVAEEAEAVKTDRLQKLGRFSGNISNVSRPHCSGGFNCVEGACLQACTTSSQCGNGMTCDSATKSCVHAGGLPFVEQIAWAVDHPAPGEPQHSVWTHAANKLEAKVDFSLGFDINAWIKLFGREFTLVDEQRSKYWNLASAGKFKYEIGMSADYDNSCAPDVGKVEVNQVGLRAGQSWTGRSSEELIETCLDTMPGDVQDDSQMPVQPTGDNVASDLTDTYQWVEDISLAAWDLYNDDICINGQPWDEWYVGENPKGEEVNPNIPVLVNGQSVGSLANTNASGTNLEQAILASSGCLAPNRPFASQVANAAGISNGQIDIFNHLIDPDGDVVPGNIKPDVRTAPQFSAWYATTQQCVTDFMNSGTVTLGLDVGPCRGSEGVTPINIDSPNQPVGTSGPLTPVRPGRDVIRRSVPSRPLRPVTRPRSTTVEPSRVDRR